MTLTNMDWTPETLRALYPQGPTIGQMATIRAAGWRIVEVDREPADDPAAVVVTAGRPGYRAEVAVRAARSRGTATGR